MSESLERAIGRACQEAYENGTGRATIDMPSRPEVGLIADQVARWERKLPITRGQYEREYLKGRIDGAKLALQILSQ